MHDPTGTAIGTAAGSGALWTMKRGYTGDELQEGALKNQDFSRHPGDEKMYPGRDRGG
jgi:hypothetical protein